jgi:CRISPR/Cas system CMR subunit Cmr6 (Cas7 group RAMP superfamily)
VPRSIARERISRNLGSRDFPFPVCFLCVSKPVGFHGYNFLIFAQDLEKPSKESLPIVISGHLGDKTNKT